MKPSRTVYIYFRLIGKHIRAILEYQADFVITMAAAMLTQILGFIFLWVVYDRIPSIQGWSFWEVAFIYAMIFFTEGFCSLFFNGIWSISALVNRGELDRYLVRPISPVVQVLSAASGINGIGNLFIGGVIIFQSFQHVDMNWTFMKALMAVVLLISTVMIRASIYLAACSSVFWTHSPGNAFGNMVHTVSDFAKFPITIYSLGVQALIGVIVPYAFISFFPASYLFGKEQWGIFGLMTPLVAVYCAFIARWIFQKGLNRYEGAGN